MSSSLYDISFGAHDAEEVISFRVLYHFLSAFWKPQHSLPFGTISFMLRARTPYRIVFYFIYLFALIHAEHIVIFIQCRWRRHFATALYAWCPLPAIYAAHALMLSLHIALIFWYSWAFSFLLRSFLVLAASGEILSALCHSSCRRWLALLIYLH